jgi:hypothetical protein
LRQRNTVTQLTLSIRIFEFAGFFFFRCRVRRTCIPTARCLFVVCLRSNCATVKTTISKRINIAPDLDWRPSRCQ